MADKDQTQQPAQQPAQQAATNGATQNPEGPAFGLQRLYLKDASFESPRSPVVFQTQWQPKISFDMKTKSDKVQDGIYEVVLTLTAEAKLEDNSAFLVEVQQAGIFTCKDFSDEQLEQLMASVCPNILFPYAREAIDALVIKGSFPPLMLSPINFDALYAQRKKAEAEKAATDSAKTEPAAGATD